MGEVAGDLLPVAVGVAISPVPIIAVILMLFVNPKNLTLCLSAGVVFGAAPCRPDRR